MHRNRFARIVVVFRRSPKDYSEGSMITKLISKIVLRRGLDKSIGLEFEKHARRAKDPRTINTRTSFGNGIISGRKGLN
jgi:hypothetical protein